MKTDRVLKQVCRERGEKISPVYLQRFGICRAWGYYGVERYYFKLQGNFIEVVVRREREEIQRITVSIKMAQITQDIQCRGYYCWSEEVKF